MTHYIPTLKIEAKFQFLHEQYWHSSWHYIEHANATYDINGIHDT